MTVGTDSELEFVTSVRRIADEVAALHAGDVDHNARFPREAIDALRDARALSAWIPEEYGGAGVSLDAIAQACHDLGRRCAATAMIFAMHQIQVGTIFRHLEGQSWFEGYLQEICAEQRLIASATSEVGTGGDMGRSIAAVTPAADGRRSLEKQAPTVSYGAHSDDILTTVRRSPEAEQSDQVMVLHRSGGHRPRTGRNVGHDRDARHLLAGFHGARRVR